jgi:phosphinothricin acetyltransferase
MPALIRLAEPTDARPLLSIYSPHVEGGATSFELCSPTEQDFAERIAATLRQRPWLVCELGGELAGYAYAGTHRSRGAYVWSVELSVYVADAHQRRGAGRALCAALFDVLRLQGYYNVYAGISLPNPTSVSFHEKLGFRPVGVYEAIGYKAGSWRDVGWWQLALREKEHIEPPPPRALPEVVAAAEFRGALAHAAECIAG